MAAKSLFVAQFVEKIGGSDKWKPLGLKTIDRTKFPQNVFEYKKGEYQIDLTPQMPVLSKKKLLPIVYYELGNSTPLHLGLENGTPGFYYSLRVSASAFFQLFTRHMIAEIIAGGTKSLQQKTPNGQIILLLAVGAAVGYIIGLNFKL